MFIVTVSHWTAATLHWGMMKGGHSYTGNVHVKFLAVKGKNFETMANFNPKYFAEFFNWDLLCSLEWQLEKLQFVCVCV